MVVFGFLPAIDPYDENWRGTIAINCGVVLLLYGLATRIVRKFVEEGAGNIATS